MDVLETLLGFWESSGLAASVNESGFVWQNYLMLGISFVLMYLAIVRKFEPLLLLPISFGMFIINLPGAREVLYGLHHGLSDTDIARMQQEFIAANPQGSWTPDYGLFHFIDMGISYVIFPPLIFLGIGAMTDFGPLIASPKSLLIGAGAQLGVFVAFFLAVIFGFDGRVAASIGIIGGADGPTAIYVTTKLAPEYLSAIAIAAYSYMALIPLIQPPIMRALTTKKERTIKMEQLREVTKRERIMFPIAVTLLCGLILPSALPLLGMLMLGNLLKESKVAERLVKTASNGLMNTVTIFLGLIVGTKAIGTTFLQAETMLVIALGLMAFAIGTVGGILTAKGMNLFLKHKINPLIGSAGVSAVPMAARVSQDVGRRYNPDNYLLMHAMGPNVAGVIGSAVAAGIFLALPF